MATHYRYRKRGGEIIGASIDSPVPWPDDAYYGFITDPTVIDAADTTIPKVWDGTKVRNATSGESAAFAANESTDVNLQARDAAKKFLTETSAFRKILASIIQELYTEIDNHILAPRTLGQVRNAILARIDAGTND